jgi:hypothetical protein|uniref:Uncharacterized protein n=1 Tax=Siphoviridae sp. ctdm01 TaxID=2825585 RepID=A0A8S5R2E6_9CAUD|nr:MAG TPA: hypothetical protein [Siphoviridae sp. ctdm01]DAU68138.1 MAG TPA: hypothetical protein [Caudoviricetes sp.]
MTLQNKNETVALNAKDKESRGYINDDLSRTDNISNNASNVNNNETKFSRDVDVDEFDDTDYNEIRLGKKEYAAVSSAITIRYANRYSDEIRSINYGDYKYYFIYNENGIRYYDRYNIEKYLKGMDDYEIHRKAKNNNRLSGLLEASERYDSSSLSSNENGRTAGNIDSLDREALQAERQSDRYGYRKDADNDNTSKKRYSRDVDYQEFYDLKRENKHTNEVQSIDALYSVNAKKEVAALDEPEFRPINGTALTTSTISIFNLLDYVNNCFPDILPEERKISVSIFSICLIMQVKTSTAELRLIIILSILSILITKTN